MDIDEILAILQNRNEKAFESGNFDAAYHLLAASLHTAQAINDADKLAAISQTALLQAEKIDAEHPEYHHSSKSARTRGNGNIFKNLAKQADTASRLSSAYRSKIDAVEKPI